MRQVIPSHVRWPAGAGILAVLLLLISGGLVPLPAQHWPAFRGDGTSLSSASQLPVQWSDQENVRWRQKLPGYGQSSPVVWGERVYVTTMQGDNKETPTLLQLELATGKVGWQREFTSTQPVAASDYVTRSSPTPVVNEQGVFAFFESGELLSCNHQGETRWQRSLVKEYGPFKGNHGIGSSLATDGELLFVLVAHEGPSYLLGVDMASGENRWKTDLPEKVSWSSPTVVDGQILLSISGSVSAYDATSGKPMWTLPDLQGNTVASVTVSQGRAFIGSSERGNNLAIDLGRSNDQEVPVAWRNDEVTSSFGSPLAEGGRVFYVSKQGVAYAVDCESGQTLWKSRLSGSCWASPIAAEGRLYFFTKDGPTDVFSNEAEPRKLATNQLSIEGRIYGVAVVPGKMLVRTGNELICLGAAE